jgi:Tol biopolymer transport system component
MIEPGKMLQQYRLVEKIGEGGMGVVWKAVDTTLDREVALKFLPDAFLNDAERLERLDREAKLLATLHHPNIASIFGMHEVDGPQGKLRFLAMELAPGEDLAQRLERGPLPLDDTVEIAHQIAQALEAAHESGVVHRDLKPANVKLTPDGKVKVLDFGLAKALGNDGNGAYSGSGPGARSVPGSGDPDHSPTITSAGTRAGMILGTAAYMSPEQARGKLLDKRTDVWSFGCVLYEMLTGRKVFDGETATDVIAAIVTREPAWAALPTSTPPSVVRLLRRCLEKSPLDRLRDIGEARIVLKDPEDEPRPLERPAGDAPAASDGRRNTRAAWVIIAAALGGALLTAAIGWMLLRPAEEPSVHLSLIPPAEAPFHVSVQNTSGVALAPDGSVLVYQGNPANGPRALFVRPLDGTGVTRLENTEGGGSPFFSPDGKWIAFFADGMLKRVPLAGGTAVTVADPAALAAGGHWSDDGFIYFSPSYYDAVYRVPAAGGTPEALTTLDAEAGDFGHWWPTTLPGGRFLLYSRWRTTVNDCSVWRRDLQSGDDRLLLEQACAPHYVPTGHLIFNRGSTIAAVRFDAGSGEPLGEPTLVIDDAFIDPANGWSPLSIAADGSLAYVRHELFGTRSAPVWVDLQGSMTPIANEPRDYRSVRISPDGRQLALHVRDRTEDDIWIHDLERGSARRFTVDGTNTDPIWTPDGRRIVFCSLRNGPYDLYWKPLDESEKESLLVAGPRDKEPQEWTDDGRMLLYTEDVPQTRNDIWAHTAEGERVLVQGDADEFAPRLSPNERWLAYSSESSGRSEIYVEAWPDRGGRWQISTDGGQDPLWSPDGSTIYYWYGNDVWAVSVDTRDGVRAGRPRRLFGTEELRGRVWDYDLHPDGDRFVVLRSELARTSPIEVVLHWFDELEERVP